MKRRLFSALTFLVSVSYCFTVLGQGEGQLWGTTIKGGKGGGGTIYSTNGDGNSYMKIRHEFMLDNKGKQPIGTLVKATNGKFYGVTWGGGAADIGTIYEFNSATGDVTTLYEFSGEYYSGPVGSLMQASDGKLYGLTYKGGSEYSGTIYSWDIATSTYKVEFTFVPGKTGVGPVGGLVEVAPMVLCGVALASNSTVNGIIFEWDKGASNYKILKEFSGGAGGTQPKGGITIGSDGLLYGVTQFGGANGAGLFYSFNRATSAYTIIHDFTGTESYPDNRPITSSNGNIYGITSNSVYKYSGGVFTTLDLLSNNGISGLYEASNDKLYTMVFRSGDFGVSILEYDRDTGVRTFKVNTDIAQGYGTANGLTGSDVAFVEGPNGKLYAGLRNGGMTGNGTLISYDVGGTTVSKIKDFGYGAGGSDPWGDLCRVGDKLYGMTAFGGNNGYGYIYEIDAVTENFVVRYHFDGTNGRSPMGGLTLASNGKLYGMTTFGGPSGNYRYFSIYGVTEVAGSVGHGVIFEFDPGNGTYTKLMDFNATTGTNPWGRLIQASDGDLYGMTSTDGANGGGTLFKYVIGSGFTKKYDFPNTLAGIYTSFGPHGTLAESGGKLYGVTPRGGTNGDGILFEYDLTGGTVDVKLSFSDMYDVSASSTGSSPMGSLTLHPNGKLYGITSVGGYNSTGGTIFEYQPGATTVTVKKVLESFLWGTTRDLTMGSGENMYGTGTSGSTNRVFEFKPATGEVKSKFVTTGAKGSMIGFGGLTFVPGKSGQVVEFPQNNFFVMDQKTITLPKFTTANIEAVYESSDVTKATVSGNIATMIGIGDVTFTATAPGNNEFEPAQPAQWTVKIFRGQQSIVFDDLSATFGDAPITLAATVTSGLPIEYLSNDVDRVKIEGNKLTILRAGTVTISAQQPGDANWYPTNIETATLTINKADQTITFGEFEKGKVGTLITPNATASSGLAVVFESKNTSLAIIDNNKVKPVAIGTVEIVAKQPGNNNYNAAPEVTRSLTSEKGPQVITVKEVPAKTVGDEFLPQATSTSGLTAFTYTTSSELTWDASRNVVKVVSAGLATLTARQVGDASWAEATGSTTFCANPAKPTISMSIQSNSITLVSSASEGNVWKKDGAVISGATSTTIPAEPGVYSVTATVEGCASQPSNDYVVSITGDIAENTTIEIFPNPASDKLYLRVPGNKGSKLSIMSSDGRITNDLSFDEESLEISLENHAAGLYLLRLNNQIIRFIKN